MGSFDGIASKFDDNIYGTSKGKLRHQLLLHYLEDILNQSSLTIADIGGGTGVMALEFAQRGHDVVNLDLSKDALDIASQRLAPFENADVLHMSLFDWTGEADVILCHAVLEWLPDPDRAITHLWQQLPVGGFLSLSFFNYHAALFGNAIYGNFDYIAKGMQVKNQVRLNPKHPHKPEHILATINGLVGAELVHTAGIRCFHDYMKDKELQASSFDEIYALELKLGKQEPYKHLAKYMHYLVQKSIN